MELATRFYNTYRCVEKGEYVDPDEMISFDSEGIENIQGLRAEICRIPQELNSTGLFQIMSKDKMLKMELKSPNMSDSVMMTLFKPPLKEDFEPIDYPKQSIV